VLEDRRAAFCARLKLARERKGVSLEEIAASTKISRSLLKGLEENDFSRWPQGLYRRSYLRDYLRAIDLPEESTVVEFVRLFPGGDSTAPAKPAEGTGQSAEESCALSMTLDDGRGERIARVRKRITAAAIDLVAVLLLSGVAWWGLHADLWASAAVVAVGYYSISTAALGYSLGSRLLEDRSWRRPKKPTLSAAPSLQDTLLERMREVKGLSGQPEPAMAGGILGMLIAMIIRTLFLR
jgi:helix-turn-helix protein